MKQTHQILQLLRRPEYVHVLINPLPIYGLALGILALVIGLWMRNRAAQTLALSLLFVSSLSAWPVYVFGERAYHRVYLVADSDGQLWLDQHMRRAEKLIYAFYILGAAAAGALAAPRWKPRTALPLALAVLALSAGTLVVASVIAYPAGKIRHPEFRPGWSLVITNARVGPPPKH